MPLPANRSRRFLGISLAAQYVRGAVDPQLVPPRPLRRQGFRFAVDDLGDGYAGVSALTLLEPDFVELDRSLVMGLEESPRRRSVVRAMVRLCTYELGIQMFALGVESPAERDTLAREGVDLMQGELFAGPARESPLPRF